MVIYERDFGGFTLSDAQRVELQSILDVQAELGKNNPSAPGLGVPIYQYIFDIVSVDNGSAPAQGVNLSVWTWLRGAMDVNAAAGPQATFIHEYTQAQYVARAERGQIYFC